ncbi:DEAD/DEAH box helicase [Mesobacillus subterraneus]|uniref:DEAD/DEAH box helicase n=1 Tax=Mesobacillus subterraneus TaxID=285983 RepID=A0A427TLH9_9BACI|nr:DEAD/DEAH box helicase [Mesobacillus subterraneus]RSD25208.1 DEAD/DEAH box helicase [Mesobacillus subterraneus]
MRFLIKEGKLIPKLDSSDDETTFSISNLPEIPQLSTNPFFEYNPELQKMLAGKQLLIDELPFTIDEIQAHYENGYLVYRKGIQKQENRPHGSSGVTEKHTNLPRICVRCGTSDESWFGEFPCARCGERDIYCPKCLMMGRVSECTPLVCWVGPESDFPVVDRPLEWAGSLSEGQQVASQRVLDAVKTTSELLVWAVAGAGKTEVLFAGINEALTSGKRVCLATPRTDVVLELTPRLKKAFPQTKIASLYGGSEERHEFTQLTIATTHQLLRFYKAFDVMIVDEVDAFPYSIDETLQYAVQQSRKLDSSLIYLTATPSKQWQKECRLGKRKYVTIPARYHRHPLPVPKLEWSGNWEKMLTKGKLPANIIKWIETRQASRRQALLFAPKIASMEKILPILRKMDPLIESVHAEDPDRKEKVMKLRNKEIPILLSTTILERGVTFPNIDVAVIGSEDRIFTESALVQIAGRAGRSADFPTGEVVFFHYGKTEAMLSARKQIEMMNKEGIKKGLIDV